MAEIRVQVDRDAVKADPFANANADCCDFVFPYDGVSLDTAVYPDSHATFPAFAFYAERRQGDDDPFFQIADVLPDIAAAVIQIHYFITDPLSRSVIGVLPTPTGGEYGNRFPSSSRRAGNWFRRCIAAGVRRAR